jgi:Zn-dependent protease with chaperone function
VKYTPRLPQENHNVTPTSPLKELFVLLGGLLTLVVSLYIVLGLGVELLVPRISPGTEQKIASLFLDNFDLVDKEDKENLYLQQLVDQMAAKECFSLPYKLRVHLVESDTINAMALPGGHILVFSDLLNIMESENELSFVLAHEIGHFKNRDHLRGMGRSLVFAFLATALRAPGKSVSNLVSKVIRITESGFSRDQESDADATGLDILQCTYGHINGATHFFKHMPKKLDPGRLGHYFASHPENEKRINTLLELARKKGYPSGQLTPLAVAKQENSQDS